MPVQPDLNKCLSCGGCTSICPVGALELKNNELTVDADKCIDCGLCIRFCPVGALGKTNEKEGTIYPKDE